MYSLDIVKNRLKIIFKDKVIWGLFAFILLLFMVITSVLVDHVDYGSRIPLVVIDEDKSPMSIELINNLENQQVFQIIQTDTREAYTLLRDGKVEGVYIIKEGYENNILNLNFNNIIEVHYLQGSTAGKIITDMVAGDMLFDMSLVKTIDTLKEGLLNNEIEEMDQIIENAYETAYELKETRAYDDIIKVELINIGSDINYENIDNTIIYKQVVIGMVSTFLAFFILFASTSIVKDKELGTQKRLEVIFKRKIHLEICNLLAIFIIGLMISVFLVVILTHRMELLTFQSIFLIALLFFVYSFALSGLFYLSSAFVEKVITMQVSGSIIIIILFVISSSFLTMDLINGPVLLLQQMIPNYWFVEGFTKVIINESVGNVLNNQVQPLLFLGITYTCIGMVVKKFK
ncbi:ABC-type multidrug transport system permease subunit [Natranaerovirga hydrolytica]|uniref:ABC-type multidrug transport system permease subunit n=1 Tax=Natranaerovirga hydrolytica TaxID=680378 RepID=A0A4R1MXA6_9FIRM|nr:ABC transporter permease [Natranaerovirga hydrolytica]TCK97836.1 ABC-type multidrug transport system permease subunit [Natranaerovirga hydrolytica]